MWSCARNCFAVSTHSRPKAAAINTVAIVGTDRVSTHSRPKAAAAYLNFYAGAYLFQHTAARRRLPRPT